jgi:hypothetical protein
MMMDVIANFPNVLLIAGSGRNVGKTLLACHIIQSNTEVQVWAVKVSSHFHVIQQHVSPIAQGEGYFIGEETNEHSTKDSSRFLKAGAERVFYIQANDEGLPNVVAWMRNNIPESVPAVVESAALGRFVKPGMAVYVKGNDAEKLPGWNFKSITIETNNEPITVENKCFKWENNLWKTE